MLQKLYETGLLCSFSLLFPLIGSNSSLNTSLPSPGAWPYSASDNSFTNVHSTSGMRAQNLTGQNIFHLFTGFSFLFHFEYLVFQSFLRKIGNQDLSG